jgi:hypothetical protein
VARLNNSFACSLSNQGQHESVSRYRGVRFIVPTDIFRTAFITGDFLAGAKGAGSYREAIGTTMAFGTSSSDRLITS